MDAQSRLKCAKNAELLTLQKHRNTSCFWRVLKVGGTQVSFKMIYWRHWRVVWAQMRSFRDPERLLDDLLEVMWGSCSAGAWPGWLAGPPNAETTHPLGGNVTIPGA